MHTTGLNSIRIRSDVIRFVIALLLLVAVAGCTTVTHVSAVTYSPVPVEHVEILYEQPQRPHEVIALIDYSGGKGLMGQDPKWMIQRCKEEAAKAGADAVIVDQIAASGSFRRSTASAKAIKWK